MLAEIGFEVEKCTTFNKIAVPAWFFNGRVLRRKKFGRVQLKLFDSLVWLWRRIDRFLPWKGVSCIVIARKKQEPIARTLGELKCHAQTRLP
jgi:hypothetical protein